MNDYQEERHNSDQLVVKIAKENPEAVKLIPAFEEGIKNLELLNDEVEKFRVLQEEDKSGVTVNKRFTMNNLINQTLDVSGAVHVCAYKKNDVLLMSKVDYKVGSLSKVVPGKVIAAAIITLEEAKKVPVADLANTGISAAELTEYEEMVTYFKSIKSSPREVQIDVSVYTKQLGNTFKEITKLYKNTLDRLARQFKTKAPEFYQKYRAARKAIHRGPENPETPGNNGPAK